jgi:hypothetical protein
MGQDLTLVYNRRPREEALKKWPFPKIPFGIWWRWGKPYVHQYIIGFCGKIYPVLRISGNGSEGVICHSLAEVDEFVDTNYSRKAAEEYRSTLRKVPRTRYWPTYERRDIYAKFFEECVAQQNAFGQLFIDNRSPIFVAEYDGRDPKIVFDAPLKSHDFFRIFDTFTAFQEIAMFFGGMAVPLKPIPEISDKDMVGIKGFNKWSFRKEPKR